MRNSKKLAPAAAAVQIIPRDYCAMLEIERVFPRPQPLEVDVGCGDGAFLAAMAAEQPERNFLGVERLLGRIRSASRRIARQGLGNVRLLRLESAYAVRYLLPPDSVTRFHLNFPDPWPKRRHQRRRLVTEEFLRAVHRALRSGGTLRFLTDQPDYVADVERLAAAELGFTRVKSEGESNLPPTTFEDEFRVRGEPIYRLLLRKVSEVR